MIISFNADLPKYLSATMAGLLKICYDYRLQYNDLSCQTTGARCRRMDNGHGYPASSKKLIKNIA